ncbi:MAG: aromatic amino acid transport family protein, partial [Candidatus Rhabdochlamydia sp.]
FWLSLMVFIPPTIVAFYNPGIFIQAIGIAGGFGEAILNGLLPISVVWIGRYRMGLASESKLPGGRLLLAILALFTLLIMGLELKNLIK